MYVYLYIYNYLNIYAHPPHKQILHVRIMF